MPRALELCTRKGLDLDPNRVMFSLGRDIRLNPPQSAEPLNYFVYPYVEIAGRKWENIANAFAFADVK